MRIYLNDEATTVDPGLTLGALVAGNSGEPGLRVAVAVNDEVIPRDRWDSHVLQEGDRLLLIAPIQGG